MRKLSTLCVLAMPMLLAAQTTEADSTRVLEEVVISTTRSNKATAVSKIEAPLKQLPITVNSITAQDISIKGYSDVVEALREVPGVHAYRQYGAFHMFYVRGFYESLIVNDGMRDERHGIWQSAPITGLGSVERIEVLKGAASMQQGHSAVGGVINIVRKDVSPTLGAYARLSAGSYNTFRLSAGATGAIGNRLLLRADVEGIKSDGWRQNYTKGYNLSLVAKYLINSKSNIQLSVYGNNDNYGGDYGMPHYPQDVYKASDNSLFAKAGEKHPQLTRQMVHGFAQDDLGHRNLSAQLKYEYHFNTQWKISNQLFASFDAIRYMSTDGFGWVRQEQADDKHPYYFLDKDDAGNDVKRYTDLNTLERWGFAFDYDTRSIQNQLELSGKVRTGAMEHKLLLGYNYLNMDMTRYDKATIEGKGYTNHITLIDPVRHQGEMTWKFGRQQQFDDQTHGVYLQDYAKWGKLSLLAGLRLDYFTRRFEVSKTDNKVVKASEGVERISNLALTYRAGLVYSPSEDVNFYVSASSFYKPQKISLSSEVVYVDEEGKEMGASELSKLPPTRGNQFELGTHLAFDKTFSLDASLFYLTLNNKLNAYLGQHSSGKKLGALVDGYVSKGFELDANYRPIDELGFSLGYSYIDARVKAGDGVNAKYTNNGGNFVEHTPMHQLSFWTFLTAPIARHSRFQFGLGISGESSFYTSEVNNHQVPGYATVSSVVSYQWGKWTLQVNANNLLDTPNVRHVLYDVQYLPSEGRNFTASLSFKL